MSIIQFKDTSNYQRDTQYVKHILPKLKKIGRAPLMLGKRLKITPKGKEVMGPQYYIPSQDQKNIENLFNYGMSGAGKTWGMFNIVGQSYFFERRCWVIIDSKGSVSYDTKVYVRKDGKYMSVPIGNIIDDYIPNGNDIHNALDIDDGLYVISLNSNHKLEWKRVTQVSKHRPMDKVLKITMRSGRKITATKNHSFITLENGKYVPIEGRNLSVGDYIPITHKIPLIEEKKYINVLDYFDPEEVVDFDQIQTAMNHPEAEMHPMVAYNNSGICSLTYTAFCRYNWGQRDIYPKHFKINSGNAGRSNPFPKKLELSEDFGFVCGLFIAEGRAENKKNERRVTITNTNPEIRDRLIKWIESIDLSYSSDGKKTVRIYSYVLAKLFAEWFGNGTNTNSHTKHLHSVIYHSNRSFLKGFLDGYMSGDGSIRPIPRKGIKFTTVSDDLKIDLNILFTIFGMSLRYGKEGNYNNGYIHSSDYKKFRQVGFTHPKKQRRLMEYKDTLGYDGKHLIDFKSILGGLNRRKEPKKIRNMISKKYSDGDFTSFTNAIGIYEELKEKYPERARKLKKRIDGDVWWDKIEKIEEIDSPSEYVYDFAVEDNENFMLSNGMVVHNSYRGNHLPNKEFASELKSFGLKPMGIPKDLMVVCAPEYYTEGMTQEEMEMDQITHKYRIPISMANIQILFAMTKLNPDTMYSSSYDMNWKRMMARTQRSPNKNDLYDMLNDIIANAPQAMSRWYDTLVTKIRDVEDLILSEEKFSPVGRALLRSAYDGLPRWIIVTFKRADNSKDEVNLAIYAAVLEEIRKVTEIVKDNDLDLRTGLWVDELQYYVSDKNSIAFSATRDAIYWWGRSNQLFRIWGTQTNRHLDKLLRDDISDKTKEGTYQKVIRFVRKGGPGYCSYMDRQLENAFNLNVPYFVPLIKTPPPMFRIIE